MSSPARRGLTRRDLLRLAGVGAAGVAAGGCSLLGGSTPQPRLLPSRARLPQAYAVPLPIPPVAEPRRTTGTTDYYSLTQKPVSVGILPDLPTPVWAYDGSFPGPTIVSRSGRRTVVELDNQLKVPTVMHLHGGHTPPESDGYPTDLLKPGSQTTHTFPLDQRAATLWYHDHRMDFTGPQVWRGLAGMFVVHDDEESALDLPQGDRDVPLILTDRSFAADGSMPYPGHADKPGAREAYMGGVLGDVILVNGAPWPSMRVDRARYRFRILNASNARAYDLSLPRGMVQIGSDGGLLTAPRRLSKIRLSPGERADIVVDFSAYRNGSNVELRNLADTGDRGRVLRFTVDGPASDDSRIPRRLSRIEPLDPSKAKQTRDFEFTSGSLHGGTGWLINGEPFDTSRVDARPKLGDVEIWRISSDVPHPVHLHLSHFQVLSVDGTRVKGPPIWKDTVELGDVQNVEILTRFTGYRGRYVFHCHNLEHEDMAMMANFEVV